MGGCPANWPDQDRAKKTWTHEHKVVSIRLIWGGVAAWQRQRQTSRDGIRGPSWEVATLSPPSAGPRFSHGFSQLIIHIASAARAQPLAAHILSI